HFDHIGSIAREKSAELILKKIASLNYRNLPVIIMGDFNSTPGSPPIEKIKTTLSDSFEVSIEKPKGPVGTYNAFNPTMPIDKRIDYIFIMDFEVLSFHHIDDRLNDNNHISDHLPVLIHAQ
ncbi:MAG: endonuclease/exonuclease/phosphatase family protein, partial [Candidatus Neomarinimicrobiota bacterium]